MTNMTMGDAAYRALLSRWSRLKETFPDACVELEEMSAQLERAELAGGRVGCIADVVDDYSFAVGEAGNLSGVELL